MVDLLQILDDPLLLQNQRDPLRIIWRNQGMALDLLRREIMDHLFKSLPNQLYTSKECLSEIQRRDKDANADYVNEYLKDVEGMGKGSGKSS